MFVYLKYTVATNKINIILFETNEKKKIIEIVIHKILNFNLANLYLICIIIIIIIIIIKINDGDFLRFINFDSMIFHI